MYIHHVAIALFISVLSSCASVTQAPLTVQTFQPAFNSTLTEQPASSTSESEKIPSATSTISPNAGTPMPDWKGVPVMPGALKGETKAFGYMYWVNATVKEVETYYSEQMDLAGWPLVKETAVLSWYGRGTLMQFKREYSNEFIDIILVVDTDDNSMMVAIKKYIYNP